FTDTSSTHIFPLSLHDALPIYPRATFFRPVPRRRRSAFRWGRSRLSFRRPVHIRPEREIAAAALSVAAVETDCAVAIPFPGALLDRKSTRLNSSHRTNSYAVFC